jgi:hypothetical protein
MERVSYKIVSRMKKSDGTPDFMLFGTTANLEYTIRFHQFHLAHGTHPNPAMNEYARTHGFNCFEYIVDPAEVKIIETATIKPKKEVRKIKA